MNAIVIIGLVLKILLLVILGLIGFILLLLAFPFHLSVTGFYNGDEFSYELQVKYAWLIPIDRIIKSRLRSREKVAPVDAKRTTKTVSTTPTRKESSEFKTSDAKRPSPKPQETKSEEPLIQGQKRVGFQEILDWITWGLEQKDTFWRAFLRLFRLLHIQPLLIRGQLGLEDPADTAFLFSAIYTTLPMVPFVAFLVQPNYHEQALSGMIRFKCHISLLEIPLTLILNRDLRRMLFMIYRMSRPKKTTMQPAEI